MIATRSYGAWGVMSDAAAVATMAGGAGGRFGYTGQTWLPELGLYHYKARYYSPTLGRFVSADPIGMAGGMNLYDYTRSDPVNKSDPLGLAEAISGSGNTAVAALPCQSTGFSVCHDDIVVRGVRTSDMVAAWLNYWAAAGAAFQQEPPGVSQPPASIGGSAAATPASDQEKPGKGQEKPGKGQTKPRESGDSDNRRSDPLGPCGTAGNVEEAGNAMMQQEQLHSLEGKSLL